MKKRPYDYSLLPPHVIVDVLKHLNVRDLLVAAETCNSWYYESLNTKLNRNTRVRIGRGDGVPKEFNRPFGILQLCSINFNVFAYNEFFNRFGNTIHKIELIDCQFALKQLFDFLSHLPNLVTFKIRSMDGYVLDDDENIIETHRNGAMVETILNRIESIEIVLACPDKGGLGFIMSLMPNLKAISIGNHHPCSNYIFKILFDYFNRFDEVTLDRLSISDLEGAPVHEFFNDFANIVPKLNIDTVTIGMISPTSYMTYDEVNFTNFCRKLSNVKSFAMKGPRECHFNNICRFMVKLKELHLTYAAITHFDGVDSLQNLEKLNLTCTVCYRGSNYDENEFMTLFTKLKHLKELSINLYPVNDRLLHTICTNCTNLTRLEILRSKTCNFTPIFNNLKKLRSLRLQISFLVAYNHFVVEHDIRNLQNLEELDINAFAPGLTMELIEQLPSLNATSLRMIKLNVCTQYVYTLSHMIKFKTG